MQLAKVQVQVQVQLASWSIQHPDRPQWGTTLATPQDFSMGHQIWKRAPPLLLSAPQISFRHHEAALFSRFAGLQLQLILVSSSCRFERPGGHLL